MFNIVGSRVPGVSYDVLGMRQNGQTMATVTAPGQPGWLGNPFVASDAGGQYSREEATQRFSQLIEQRAQDPAWRQAFLSLAGKNVGYYKPDEQFIHLQPLQEWIARNHPQGQQWLAANRPSKGAAVMADQNPRTYEVSSAGDKRFSAFNARIKGRGNRSIEDIYQTDGKGYATKEEGKGRPPRDPNFDSSGYYDNLWREWAAENPELMRELIELRRQGVSFTDQFSGRSMNNQASTLMRLADEALGRTRQPASAAPKSYYAGIGSRQTPPDIRRFMAQIAGAMERDGYGLRSGGASGADAAFESGITNPANQQVFLPGKQFNDRVAGEPGYLNATLLPGWQDALETVGQYHPNPGALKEFPYRLQARNAMQVLGSDLQSPSDVVIAWTKGASGRGGTGQALRIAQGNNVPIIDLGNPATRFLAEQAMQRGGFSNWVQNRIQQAIARKPAAPKPLLAEMPPGEPLTYNYDEFTGEVLPEREYLRVTSESNPFNKPVTQLNSGELGELFKEHVLHQKGVLEANRAAAKGRGATLPKPSGIWFNIFEPDPEDTSGVKLRFKNGTKGNYSRAFIDWGEGADLRPGMLNLMDEKGNWVDNRTLGRAAWNLLDVTEQKNPYTGAYMTNNQTLESGLWNTQQRLAEQNGGRRAREWSSANPPPIVSTTSVNQIGSISSLARNENATPLDILASRLNEYSRPMWGAQALTQGPGGRMMVGYPELRPTTYSTKAGQVRPTWAASSYAAPEFVTSTSKVPASPYGTSAKSWNQNYVRDDSGHVFSGTSFFQPAPGGGFENGPFNPGVEFDSSRIVPAGWLAENAGYDPNRFSGTYNRAYDKLTLNYADNNMGLAERTVMPDVRTDSNTGKTIVGSGSGLYADNIQTEAYRAKLTDEISIADLQPGQFRQLENGQYVLIPRGYNNAAQAKVMAPQTEANTFIGDPASKIDDFNSTLQSALNAVPDMIQRDTDVLGHESQSRRFETQFPEKFDETGQMVVEGNWSTADQNEAILDAYGIKDEMNAFLRGRGGKPLTPEEGIEYWNALSPEKQQAITEYYDAIKVDRQGKSNQTSQQSALDDALDRMDSTILAGDGESVNDRIRSARNLTQQIRAENPGLQDNPVEEISVLDDFLNRVDQYELDYRNNRLVWDEGKGTPGHWNFFSPSTPMANSDVAGLSAKQLSDARYDAAIETSRASRKGDVAGAAAGAMAESALASTVPAWKVYTDRLVKRAGDEYSQAVLSNHLNGMVRGDIIQTVHDRPVGDPLHGVVGYAQNVSYPAPMSQPIFVDAPAEVDPDGSAGLTDQGAGLRERLGAIAGDDDMQTLADRALMAQLHDSDIYKVGEALQDEPVTYRVGRADAELMSEYPYSAVQQADGGVRSYASEPIAHRIEKAGGALASEPVVAQEPVVLPYAQPAPKRFINEDGYLTRVDTGEVVPSVVHPRTENTYVRPVRDGEYGLSQPISLPTGASPLSGGDALSVEVPGTRAIWGGYSNLADRPVATPSLPSSTPVQALTPRIADDAARRARGEQILAQREAARAEKIAALAAQLQNAYADGAASTTASTYKPGAVGSSVIIPAVAEKFKPVPKRYEIRRL